MKLAICIPAFNEEKTIGRVIESIPSHIHGISVIKVFVTDDGSTDKTAEVALEAGQKVAEDFVEVIRVRPNRGLANAFLTGIHKALASEADFLVNIDADGQYRSEEIVQLINPLLRNEADMVIGDRQVRSLRFMSKGKKYGNIAGSWFLRKLTGSKVRDASSGFRAYTRKTAQMIEVHSKHTYTHENLIQAHYSGIRIAQMPITFISRTDGTSSRLISGLFKHIYKSLQGIFAAWRRWRR